MKSVSANKSVLPTHPFYVVVTLTNRANAKRRVAIAVTSPTEGELAKRAVVARSRARTVVKLPISLATVGRNPLTVDVTGLKPRRVTVDVVEFKARPSSLIVP